MACVSAESPYGDVEEEEEEGRGRTGAEMGRWLRPFAPVAGPEPGVAPAPTPVARSMVAWRASSAMSWKIFIFLASSAILHDHLTPALGMQYLGNAIRY